MSYDLTKLKLSDSGMVQTGLGSYVNPNYLSDEGYQSALKYSGVSTGTPKKDVSSLSTDSAQGTLKKKLDSLNQLSPETQPGYTPSKKEIPAPVTPPKAYFTNANGQEAEYTQEQLNDSNIQSSLQSGGYAMSRTEGPTLLQGNVSAMDKKMEDLANDFLSYNVEKDPAFAAKSQQITAKYGQLYKEMQQINYQRAQSLKTLGYRSGTTQYAGGVQSGLEGEELNQANQRLLDIINQETDKIATAREAMRTGKYTDFANSINALDKIRDNKAKELEDYNKKLETALNTVTDANVKAQDSINDIMKEVGKYNAPPEVLDAINNSTSVAGAIKAAGDYMQGGSGIVGEYIFYKRQAESKGMVPVDFDTYQTQDANRKAKTVSGVGSTAGLPSNFVSGMNAGQTGSALLNTLSPIDKATLTAILNYTKSPANLSLRKPAGEAQSEREKFLSMAHLIDPTYDEAQYPARAAIKKDFTSGKSAQNIRSLNTAVGHLNTLSITGTALINSPYPLWNLIANKGISAVGDPRVVAFNTAATAVESELAAVFKGMGATDQEIKEWRKNINSSQSPTQIKTSIDMAIELMASRMEALQSQYEQGIGKPKDFAILNANSRRILEKLGVAVDNIDPVYTDMDFTTGDNILQSQQNNPLNLSGSSNNSNNPLGI